MAPTLVSAPFHRSGWIYEEKVDGYSMLAYKDGDRVRLVSRNGVDHIRRYADVAAAVAKLGPSTLVLDGELAVFDEQLPSRFEWLRDPDDAVVATPPVLIAFDVRTWGARRQPAATTRAPGAPRRCRRGRGLHLPGAAACT
jgi:bifunctional non-homologous end joining protein LigD